MRQLPYLLPNEDSSDVSGSWLVGSKRDLHQLWNEIPAGWSRAGVCIARISTISSISTPQAQLQLLCVMDEMERA